MEYSHLEVTVISAHDLDNTDGTLDFSSSGPPPREVYAVLYVMIGGNVYALQTTPADRTGGNNPQWHYTAGFLVPREYGRHGQINLHFSLLCKSPRGDYGVGVVGVSLEELLRKAAQYTATAGGLWSTEFLVSGRLTAPSGRLRGVLRFAVRYREEAAAPTRGVGPVPLAEYSSSTDGSPEPVSPAPSAPSLHLGEFGGSPLERRLSCLRNMIELVASLSTGLLIRRLLCEGYLVRRFLPPPPPAGMLYAYVPTLPLAPPPPPAVVGLHWPAVLLLAAAIVAIWHAHRARGLHRLTNI